MHSPEPSPSRPHSALFKDTNGNTYFCPRLIRKGIRRLQQLSEELRANPPPPPHMGASLSSALGNPLVVFSHPVWGFDNRGLLLLGPLHVELSSGHRWNHPPLQQPAPPPVPADRVEVSSIFAPRYSTGSIGGPTHRRMATGLEPAPPRLAPGAPPLGQRPPQMEYAPPQ